MATVEAHPAKQPNRFDTFMEKSFAEMDDTEKEVCIVIHQLEMVQAGLAVRRAGLVWMLPLCHDSFGEGAG